MSAQLEVLARQFDEMEDAYLRERKADLEQVVERLLRSLSKGVPSPVPETEQRDFQGDEPWFWWPATLPRADMLNFKRSVFTGFVTDVGGKTRTPPSWRAAWTFRLWWARARPAA